VLANNYDWIFTDMPIFAVYAGIPVPPETAVVSGKSRSTGNLTDTRLLEIIQKYDPEQILLGRFDIPVLENYVEEHYKQVLSQKGITLYIRSDIRSSDGKD